MMTDFFEETFADLDEFYPNSKRKRRVFVAPEPKAINEWDSRPFIKTLPNGRDIEMFTLNSLAVALNRPVHTLRMWMNVGHLPSAPYRLPAKPDKNGKDRAGRRLYSRAMIDAAVEVFQKANILTASRVEWTLHQQVTIDLAEAWNSIRASETQTNEGNHNAN
jgi:hypothetical protein